MVKAGIILHDIVKPVEMVSEYGMVLDYSNQGKLIGHTSMASNWITAAALKLGVDLESNVVIAEWTTVIRGLENKAVMRLKL